MSERIITQLGEWGYDLADLPIGTTGPIICHPPSAMIDVEGDYEVVDYREELHGDSTDTVMGDRVALIKSGVLNIAFPIPVWEFVMYVGSDTPDADKLHKLHCFNGEHDLGGDFAKTPVGPAHANMMHQLYVKMIFRSAFPGYTPRPITHAIFDPKGDDAYFGRLFAKVD